VRAGCGAIAPERDHVLDLGERQPESASLTHEGRFPPGIITDAAREHT
jgi:hypothetical protein